MKNRMKKSSPAILGFLLCCLFVLATFPQRSQSVSLQPSCAPLPSGLVSCWTGDGSANDIVGGNNGTLQNGASLAAGEVGQAFNLDGTDDYINVSDSTSLDAITTAITVDCWIKPDVPTGLPPLPPGVGAVRGAIFSRRDPNVSEHFMLEIRADGRVGITLRTTTSPTVIGSVFSSVDPIILFGGQWQHIAATADATTGQVKCYVNGQEVPLATEFGPTTFGGQLFPVNHLFIGRRQDFNDAGEGAAGSSYYKGLIDEIDLFNRALSNSEIQAIFNAGIAGKCTLCQPLGAFTYSDFGSVCGLSLVGNAAQAGNRLRLTASLANQKGGAWFNTKQLVESGFETTFQFQITDSVSGGADGLTFVIQNNSLSALGDFGGSLGYGDGSRVGGIPNSVAVEFDTWLNRLVPDGIGDPSENHVSVHTRGTLPNSPNEAFSLGATSSVPNMSDGNIHAAKIAYTPGNMKVFVDDLDTPVLTVQIELETTLSLDVGRAWVGFTAATGDALENHDILSWTFTSASACNITCSNDVILSSDPGKCGSIVNYSPPTSDGSCETVTCTPSSGSFFPVGTTTVVCATATGSSCSFTVTVQDTEPPAITCPGNISVSENPPGSGSAVVSFPAPAVSDNCSSALASCTPASGSSLPLGVTTVTCTATDASGNTASCSFMVTITGPSLYGRIGIWDGTLWPLDGTAVRSIKVRATRLSDGSTSLVDATKAKPNYRFDDLPQGVYEVTLDLEYVEIVTVDSSGDCIVNKEVGCKGQALRKAVKKTVTNVLVPRTEPQDIKLPLPLVMVHGIRSCFEKWYKQGNSNEAKSHWDNFARERGFICLTPNYHYEVKEGFWLLPASEVASHIEQSFKRLTSRASLVDFPRWVFIGHSQGGLISRVLINDNFGPLISSLRRLFLLGTPNSGALSPVLPRLGCFSYLTEDQMQSDFNLKYPTFGPKDVTVYAGTRSCDVLTKKNCVPVPTDNDSLVSVESVHNIYLKPCLICPSTLLQNLNGEDLFYTHNELGSPESLEILFNRILPQVLTLSGP